MIIFSDTGRAKMTAHKFRIGDPVWAKMKGFSPWPGKVSQTSTDYRRIFHATEYILFTIYVKP